MNSLLILYGSETGNAQDNAELIEREAQRRHISTRLLPADAYLPHVAQLPHETAVVVVVSTTGQGEPPHNISGFWKFLRRKSLPADSLTSVGMAVFGLGDSGYVKYNIMAKLIYRRLLSLGARTLCPLGLGDDQHPGGHEAALDEWLPQLWTAMRAVIPRPPGIVSEPAVTDISSDLPPPKYIITLIDTSSNGGPQQQVNGQDRCLCEHSLAITAAAALEDLDAAATGLLVDNQQPSSAPAAQQEQEQQKQEQCYTSHKPWFSQVTQNQRLTASTHYQDVRLIELDLTGSGISFEPGDVLAMWPRQRSTTVAAFLDRVGLDPKASVQIESQRAKISPFNSKPVVVTIEALVAGVMDIDGAVPRRSFFQMLARFASNEREREKLTYFGSALGRDDLYDYNRREGRTVLEVLNDFPSVKPPLGWLLQSVPRLQPRRFSIASSLRQHPSVAQLLVAIVDWTTLNRRVRKGVCTRWLEGLNPHAEPAVVPVWIEKGALRLPPSHETPLIMVGPGTGVAPFRSFIQEKMALLTSGKSSIEGENGQNSLTTSAIAPCVLVFGCRSAAGDFYCKTEWEAAIAAGVLGGPGGGLISAFSRDQASKVYVSHKIREHGKELWELLAAGAMVYVAGSADKMPSDVAAAFRDVIVTHGGLEKEEAEKMLKQMEARKRYQVEAW